MPSVASGDPADPSDPELAGEYLSWTDIPPAALEAYRRAELVMQSSAPGCGLDWEILAGIGRVESDHGRFGDATVNSDGTTTPPIYGVPLDGEGDVAAVSDTDNGTLDADPVWDRAVGPMQFLPSTWEVVGVDADDDGKANPFDLDDAALAAAVYLCAGDVDLTDRAQLRAALWRYNPSEEYVELVLSYIDAYRRSDSPPPSTPVPTPVDQVPTLDEIPDNPVHPSTSHPDPEATNTPTHPNGTTTPPPNDPSPTPPPDDPSPTPPPDDPSPTPPPDDPAPTPPPDDPSPTPPPDDPSPTPPPDDPSPTPPPDDTSDPPTSDDPSDPPPDEPALTDASGTLQQSDTGDWTLDGSTLLDFGPDDYVSTAQAEHDYDADGTVELVVDELKGLAGQQVQLQVDDTDTADVVYTINEMEYRPADGSPPPWESSA